MCLSSLTKTDKTITHGYKIFIQNQSGELIQVLMPIHEDTRDPKTGKIKLTRQKRDMVPIGIWLKATRQRLMVNSVPLTIYYWSGFHFFETVGDVQHYQEDHKFILNTNCWFGELVIKKIEVKEIVASGFQDCIPCHVARYMRILC